MSKKKVIDFAAVEAERLAGARKEAQRVSNRTGSPTLVYKSLLRQDEPAHYGVSFTVPIFGQRIGERYYPQPSAPIPENVIEELCEDCGISIYSCVCK
jgi:hypothetical protein